jgi:hypothetical protein
VDWCPHASFNGHDDEVWDKVGQAVGSLQSLKSLCLSSRHGYDDEEDCTDEDDEDEDSPIPKWEMLARILRRVQQNVTIILDGGDLRTIQEVQAFARAIRGHPSITALHDHGMFPYESSDTF